MAEIRTASMRECTKAFWIFSGLHFVASCAGALRFTLSSETNTSTLVLPITNASDTIKINCTAGNAVLPLWYVNGSRYSSSQWFVVSAKTVNGSLFSYLTFSPSPFVGQPLVIQCGYNDTILSNGFAVIWIKDSPRFNCVLNVTTFGVSWDHCVNDKDFINHYIIYITTTTTNRSYITFGTTFALLDGFILCGTRHSIKICPVNPVGEGEAANSNFFVPCISSQASFTHWMQATPQEPFIASLREDRHSNLIYLVATPIFTGAILTLLALVLLVKCLRINCGHGENDKCHSQYFIDHVHCKAKSPSVKTDSIHLEDCPAYGCVALPNNSPQ